MMMVMMIIHHVALIMQVYLSLQPQRYWVSAHGFFFRLYLILFISKSVGIIAGTYTVEADGIGRVKSNVLFYGLSAVFTLCLGLTQVNK